MVIAAHHLAIYSSNFMSSAIVHFQSELFRLWTSEPLFEFRSILEQQ